ncbi:glycosyltransferase family protein [uncultured Methylobacterium sp.]|uniref:glycosyltransferase family protein n=1 Tax=uncultured Methylobacterium sp. TaxID=157278 RepID=UPI0035CA0900
MPRLQRFRPDGQAFRRDGTATRAARVLIYSHDTFGLGHLRRSRAIANALAGTGEVEAMIVSGSAVVDRFAFARGVASVRVPGVTKLPDGGYASLDPHIPLAETVARRAHLVARTADGFRPDLMIVDKEPTGFQGEIVATLERLAARGCRLVLGLRDVLDDAERLVPEWERKGASDAVRRFYDEVWVYGLPCLYRPLAALPVGAAFADRTTYTGYLRRAAPPPRPGRAEPGVASEPFILVTPGGGGDGDGLIDWVIAAYEADPGIPLPALIAFGPFLAAEGRAAFLGRIAKLPGRLSAITFDSQIELLMEKAEGLVAMGGYNTFCEILSFDKRAVLVPRTHPRREQEIRAVAADALGLARVLLEADGREPLRMAAALRALPDQPPPSRAMMPGLLGGLDVIAERVRALTAPAPDRALGAAR